MPGLFGLVGHAQDQRVGISFTRMFEPAVHDFAHESLTDRDGRWALGRTHLGVLQPGAQLVPANRVHVLFHGDLHNVSELSARAGLTGQDAGDAAQTIAALYEQLGDGVAQQLDGAYCAAIVDTARHRVVLLSDLLSSYPLYWTTIPGGLVFASELSAVLRHPGVRRDLDPAAVADYITFGMTLGSKTLAEGVELLPAGSALSWDWSSGAVHVQRIADIATAFQPWTGTKAEYVDALCETFAVAVRQSTDSGHALGLSLSGGLDSRAILGALNGQRGRISTYTLGTKGCADEVIAAKLSRIAGTRHTFFELDNRYLHDFLPNLARMVSLTDGMYLSHGLTEMLALSFMSSTDFSVLVRGHGGELAKTDLAWPLHTDDRVRTMTSATALVPYLLERTNYISPGLDPSAIFTEAFAGRVNGTARRSLEEVVAGVQLTPADLCSYLYLTQHHRRSTIPSLELFRQKVEVRLPFVDRRFLEVLFRGDPSWRADTAIHRAVTRAGDASLLRVRNSNTGAPADAGPLTEKVLDKFNTLFKRLNVPGYRHYHNFQAWMETQLLTSVETTLLSPTSLERGVLREDGVRRLLDETRQGQRNHAYLLQVLLILELWQRENL